MLIVTPRHSQRDLEHWVALETLDAQWARTRAFQRRVDEAQRAIEQHLSAGLAYVGVSWGKDSTVVAHLACEIAPLRCVVARPVSNPECALVRDRFLAQYPFANYRELEVWCSPHAHGWTARGTLEAGFALVAQELGTDRYISGIRGQESAGRSKRIKHQGLSGERACAPLGRWSGADVFAYLHVKKLPVHPVYAYSMDGALDRDRLRVSALGRLVGRGVGRLEWERRYYGDEMFAIEQGETPCV